MLWYMFNSFVRKLSGLFSNLAWLATTGQYLVVFCLVMTFFSLGLNQNLNFWCFLAFKENLSDIKFLLNSRLSNCKMVLVVWVKSKCQIPNLQFTYFWWVTILGLVGWHSFCNLLPSGEWLSYIGMVGDHPWQLSLGLSVVS